MTVLRLKAESLSRSYRQSFRWCSVVAGSELHLRRTKEASRSSFLQEVSLSSRYFYRHHAFSTFSSGDDLKPVLVASVTHILEVASNEARQASSKAPQSVSFSSSSPFDAAEAARAMLALTLPTKPLAEAILNDEAPKDQVACLHRAFVQVTSWCISLVPSDSSLLQDALDLARRTRDLSLPLHLFLYRSLVTAIAQHAEEEDPISAIIEVSALAVSALNVSLSASFFSGALVAFVKRNDIQKAIHLVRVMKERHDIVMDDALTAMAVVEALQEAAFKDRDRQLDGSNACSLLTMVSGPLLQSVDYSKVESLQQYLENTIETLMKRDWEEEEDDSDDEYDTDSGDEIDDYYDDSHDGEDVEEDLLESVDECWRKFIQHEKRSRERIQTLHEQRLREMVQTLKDRGAKVVDVSEMNEYEELESLPPFPIHSLDDETDDMTKEMLYLRTSKANTWMLPDVFDQLVQLSRGEDVLYTREYEEDIIEEMFDWQEGHF